MQAKKRILSVTIKRMFDDSPDTSWLGEYSNKAKTEYAIDRAHSEDCDSVREEIRRAKQTLEHVQQTIGDFYNAVLAQYNGTLANEALDTERDVLDNAYDEVGELIEIIDECDCGFSGEWHNREYRYFNPCHENYSGLPDADIRKYVRQDYERMESLNSGHWCFIGIRAECEIVANVIHADNVSYARSHGVTQTITSGGLWGIESDSDKSYLESVEKDELSDLRDQLKALGFSTRAISSAFKSIERKEE